MFPKSQASHLLVKTPKEGEEEVASHHVEFVGAASRSPPGTALPNTVLMGHALTALPSPHRTFSQRGRPVCRGKVSSLPAPPQQDASSTRPQWQPRMSPNSHVSRGWGARCVPASSDPDSAARTPDHPQLTELELLSHLLLHSRPKTISVASPTACVISLSLCQ